MKARIEFYATLWLLALVGKGLLAFAPPPLAFGTRQCGGRGGLYMTPNGGRDASNFCRQHCILYSTPSKDDDSDSETTVLTKEKLMSEARVTPAAAAAAVPTTEPEEEDNTQQQLPPIDLPSPLLLGTSMVLAIAGTGKLLFYLFLSGRMILFGFLLIPPVT